MPQQFLNLCWVAARLYLQQGICLGEKSSPSWVTLTVRLVPSDRWGKLETNLWMLENRPAPSMNSGSAVWKGELVQSGDRREYISLLQVQL